MACTGINKVFDMVRGGAANVAKHQHVARQSRKIRGPQNGHTTQLNCKLYPFESCKGRRRQERPQSRTPPWRARGGCGQARLRLGREHVLSPSSAFLPPARALAGLRRGPARWRCGPGFRAPCSLTSMRLLRFWKSYTPSGELKTRRAAGGQDVVGAGAVVAQALAGVSPQKDGPGVL